MKHYCITLLLFGSTMTFADTLTTDVPVKQTGKITVTNYAEGETVRYPVPLFRGTLGDTGCTEVTVINHSSTKGTQRMTGIAKNGNFRALAELVPGTNSLEFIAGAALAKLTVEYKPQTNPYYVRVIYFTDKTGATQLFHTAELESPKDFTGRLATMARIIQTFSGEKMKEVGYGRKTFRLEEDAQGDVKVHVVKGDLTMEEYHAMSREKLYNTIREELQKKMPDEYAKNIVIPAFSYFDRKKKRNLAYTAEGGNNLALFGGSNLYSWPRKLNDVQRAFMDAREIDTDNFSNDSVGRNVFWANMSTTYGAVLHELGHAFDLFHINDTQAIMLRGMDRISRPFVVEEAPSKRVKQAKSFTRDEEGRWSPGNANLLAFQRWFAENTRTFTSPGATKTVHDTGQNALTVTSPYGIGAVLVGTVDILDDYVPIEYAAPAPKSVTVSLAKYGEILKKDRALLQIIDAEGNVSYSRMKDVLPREK